MNGIRLTLTSSFVLNGDLSSVAAANGNLQPGQGGEIFFITDTDGTFRFDGLPLGAYRLVASKVEDNGYFHEFEDAAKVVELTLSNPNQSSVDYVDISVFPVGGRVRSLPYDLNPNNPETPDDDLLVEDVIIEAKPLSGNSVAESNPSLTTADATGRNYSLPMFGGEYQFFARRTGRQILLDPTVPSAVELYTAGDNTAAVRIVTITGATSQIHFTDKTKRTLTVTVEDSGGFPIQVIPDLPDASPIKDVPIDVNATLSGKGKTATNPVKAAADFEGQGIVFRDSENPDQFVTQIDIDLTRGDDGVTMVVPVKIQLEFDPKPNLMDIFDTNDDGMISDADDFYQLLTNGPDDNPPGFGLTDEEITELEAGLEGYMFYYTPDLQTHTYALRATANGHPVEDYTLAVTDGVSQLTDDLATTENITVSFLFQADLADHENDLTGGNISADLEGLFNNAGVGLSDEAAVRAVTFSDGSDGWMIIDGDNTYLLQTDGDKLHADVGTYTVTGGLPSMDTSDPPNVQSKQISFQAKKDGYTASDTVNDFVIVLGDRLRGTAAQIVSIPNVNYLVLHDPPGDESYAFVEDDLTVKGIVEGMKIRVKGGAALSVFPAPWSVERNIKGADLEKIDDLESKGLLDKRNANPAGTSFLGFAVIEFATGAVSLAAGPVAAFALQFAKAFTTGFATGLATDTTGLVQYEISVNRSLETPSGDSLGDLMGPGRGDIYFGEGWTLGFQDRYRFGLTFDGANWSTDTTEITTYDILDRTNQYVYTTRDIENIIDNLDGEIAGGGNAEADDLAAAQQTWLDLLEKNIAYQWSEFYVENADKLAELEAKEAAGEELSTLENWQLDHLQTAETNIANAGGDTFEGFRQAMGLPEDSDTASKKQQVETLIFSAGPEFQYSRTISEASISSFTTSVEMESEGAIAREDKFGPGTFTPVFQSELSFSLGFQMGIQTEQGLSGSYDSGQIIEQKVGFVLQDDDVGDNYATRVYKDPVWGTPLFIHDLGNVTSDPWMPGTNRAVDINLETVPTQLGFLFADPQINTSLLLTPRFADLKPPETVITAPYDGERISPAMFDDIDDTFTIKAISSDSDIENIRIESRSKRQDGVWGEWSLLGGLEWTDGVDAPPTDLGGNPARFRYIFDWTSTSINTLGVGEYQLRALATDKAGNPTVNDRDLPTAPAVEFLVDANKPTVLTTIPNYQDKESERIYKGELSATFTDDMTEHDFIPDTFEVIDLLESDALLKKVSGFVSYSPALRKAIFVPEVPFQSNGFYKVTIKTDNEDTGVTGVHDLAGNPLDQDFSWTFRTTDSPFEEEWSLTFSVTDNVSTDANNIAGVEYGALDMGDLEEDERDARAPNFSQKIRFSFLNMDEVEFDRDMRPADGRLSHHWFFVIDYATNGEQVTIQWQPSIKLVSTLRQYQDIWLVEFDVEDDTITIRSRTELDPTEATFNEATGEFDPIEAHTYTNEGEESRYFRLDVQKVSFVAQTFNVGTSGWKFLSVPITPQLAEPFVNLGDDIDPFQLYQYDTELGGYKIYPFDIGEIGLQTGHGYFTLLEDDVEVDVGGAQNYDDATLTLDAAGWHAIGNPFVTDVNVADLIVNDGSTDWSFADAVTAGLVGDTLYRWNTADKSAVFRDETASDGYESVTSGDQLSPWDGYWLETKQSNLTLKIPAPDDLPSNPPSPDYLTPPMAPSNYELRTTNYELKKGEFDLRFALTSDFASDLTTALGVRQNAKLGLDKLDSREPPILGQTVAAYFGNTDSGKSSGKYNRDIQSFLKAGEQRTWQLTVHTDKSDAEMTLSWEETIKSVPDDIMLTFRRTGEPKAADWQDMRRIRSVELTSSGRITSIPFEIRAQRFVMVSPADVKVIAGEKRVEISWAAADSPFIEGYTIYRANDSDAALDALAELEANANQFVDVSVEEEATYTYQVSVRFKTGAERHSERFTVTVLPVIKRTILLQSYPNPFNPETWIPYELAQEADVRIDIYNASGQLIRTLELGRQPRGRYVRKDTAAYWDGRNRLGEHAANGLYFYVLKAGNFTATRKMVIVK